FIPGPPDISRRQERKQRSWSACGSPAPSSGTGWECEVPTTTVGRFSVASSRDESSDSPSRLDATPAHLSLHSYYSYASSDNESEFEDTDVKKELQRLREKHMKEITELQAYHRREIEVLYSKLGKPFPPAVGASHTAPPTGRRRRASKHRLKPGKLFSPLVQQLKSATSKTSWTQHHPAAERVTYKPSGKARARFLTGPQSAMSTPPPHQPMAGLAQAQANNSNNKSGTFTDDLHKMVDDWAQGTLEMALTSPTLSPTSSTPSLNSPVLRHAGMHWLWDEFSATQMNFADSQLPLSCPLSAAFGAPLPPSLSYSAAVGVPPDSLTSTDPQGGVPPVPLYAALWLNGDSVGAPPEAP
ncbi:hypothetical protein JZ751_009989, partial [Albula glossodonta]